MQFIIIVKEETSKETFEMKKNAKNDDDNVQLCTPYDVHLFPEKLVHEVAYGESINIE